MSKNVGNIKMLKAFVPVEWSYSDAHCITFCFANFLLNQINRKNHLCKFLKIFTLTIYYLLNQRKVWRESGGERKKLEFIVDVPGNWQGSKYLSHRVLSHRVHISTKLCQKWSWDLNPGPLITYVCVYNDVLIIVSIAPF